MVSIPLSLAIGRRPALLHRLHASTSSRSSAFVIALGLLVDDSIVVVENIARFRREGHVAGRGGDRRHAADRGRRARLHGHARLRVRAAAGPARRSRARTSARCRWRSCCTVLASLFVSLTIIPWLASLLLRKDEAAQRQPRPPRVRPRHRRAPTRRCSDRALARAEAHAARSRRGLVAARFALVPVVGFSLFPEGRDAAVPRGHPRARGRAASTPPTRRRGSPSGVVGGATGGPVDLHLRRPRQPADLLQRVYRGGRTRRWASSSCCFTGYDPKTTPRAARLSCAAELAALPGGADRAARVRERAADRRADRAAHRRAPISTRCARSPARVERPARGAPPGTQYVNNPVRLAAHRPAAS